MYSKKDEERYSQFTTELEALSVKYGISLKAIGGVIVWEEGELEGINYSDDITSGDLYALQYKVKGEGWKNN